MVQTDLSAVEMNLPSSRDGHKLERERAFIDRLRQDCKDNGKAASLRRNAGKTISEARNVNWFFGLLASNTPDRDDEAHFLVATLFAFDKDAISENRRFDGDFGTTVRMLKASGNKKRGADDKSDHPLDRRFNILLDADFDPNTGGELAFRLRQMVKLVLSKRDPLVRINWPQLLYDLKRWTHERKHVQKRWARSYYAPLPEPENDDTENTNTQHVKGENNNAD